MLYYYYQKIYSLLDGLKLQKINSNKKLMDREIYNYEEAENFEDYDNIIPFSNKQFWYCIGINTEEDRYILHTKTNVVFSKNLKLIGKAEKEDGKYYLIEVEDMDKNIVDWYYKCLDKTYEEIRSENQNDLNV
jgi:hypothetical protein